MNSAQKLATQIADRIPWLEDRFAVIGQLGYGRFACMTEVEARNTESSFYISWARDALARRGVTWPLQELDLIAAYESTLDDEASVTLTPEGYLKLTLGSSSGDLQACLNACPGDDIFGEIVIANDASRGTELSVDDFVSVYAGRQNLRRIDLDSQRFAGGVPYDSLNDFDSLWHVNIFDDVERAADFDFLESSANLKSLSFAGGIRDAQLFQASPRLPSLESLSVESPGWEFDASRLVSLYPNLTSISIASNECDDEQLERLRELRKLESISIRSDSLTDAGLESIAEIDGLKAVSLDCLQVTATGLWKLSELPNLTKAKLAGIELSDGVIEAISHCEELEDLDLSKCGHLRVSHDGWLHLVDAINLMRLVLPDDIDEDLLFFIFRNVEQLFELLP